MKSKPLLVLGAVAAAVAILSVTVFAWRWVIRERSALRAQEASLEQLPEITARQLAAQSELDKRVFDVQRVNGFLVAKDQIGAVVSEIEAAAREAGVEMTVPAVEEKEQVDETGKVVPLSGPLFEVRLKIVATGTPAALLRFLHAAEHIQRLVYLESFRLDGSDETSRRQARALRRAADQAQERPALLSADMVVAVQREEEGGSL